MHAAAASGAISLLLLLTVVIVVVVIGGIGCYRKLAALSQALATARFFIVISGFRGSGATRLMPIFHERPT